MQFAHNVDDQRVYLERLWYDFIYSRHAFPINKTSDEFHHITPEGEYNIYHGQDHMKVPIINRYIGYKSHNVSIDQSFPHQNARGQVRSF